MNKQLLAVGVLVVLLMGCNKQAETINQQTTEEANDVATQLQNQLENKTFAITAEEYRTNMVAVVKQMGIEGFNWDTLNLETADGEDYFALMLNDTVGTKGTVNKAGQLKTITYVLAQNENMEEDLYGLIAVAGISASILNPAINKEDAEAKIVALLTKTAKQAETTGIAEDSLEDNGLKYAMKVDNHQGVWLVISPV